MNGRANAKAFFIIAGILFLVATVLLVLYFVGNKRPEGYEEITAVIGRITEERNVVRDTWTHHAFVNYTYKGVYYSDVEVDAFMAGMAVGQSIQLFVNPNNPAQITASGNAQLGMTMLITSIVIYATSALTIGGTFIYKAVSKRYNHQNR